MSIRYSVRYVLQGRYQGLSLFDAAFDLTWLTCLSSENGHLPGTLRSPVQISYVQRLVDAGFSLKTIGDFAGHRSAASTEIYAKVAVESLRQVALGDGEEVLG